MKRIKINDEETNYFITKNGEVYSEKTKKFLKGDINSGYKRVLLCLKNKKRIRKMIHNLVAEAFIPNPNNFPIVHHKDGNRFNNSIENLEWIDYSENVKKENKKIYPKIKNTFLKEELDNEKWKPFRTTNYFISNLGRLKNINTNKIIEGHINYVSGYIRDTLCLKTGKVIIPRHRIVYEAFNPEEKIKVINHIDGIRFNNRLTNLENVSFSENLQKAYTDTKTRKTRKCLCYKKEEFFYFFSISDTARYFKCNEAQIRNAMNRKGTYKGYKIYELTEEEYNKILIEGSETIERIIREKESNE